MFNCIIEKTLLRKYFLVYLAIFLVNICITSCSSSSSFDYLEDANDAARVFLENNAAFEDTEAQKQFLKDKDILSTFDDLSNSYYQRAAINLDLALWNYKMALSSSPYIKDSLLYSDLYCFVCSKAIEYFPENKFAAFALALNCHSKRVELFPEFGNSYGWLITLNNDIGNTEKSIFYAESLLKIMPTKDKAYSMEFIYDWLIYLYYKSNNYEKVLEIGNEITKLRSDDLDYYKLGKASENLGYKEKSIEWMQRSKTLGNKDAQNWLIERGIQDQIDSK